MENINKKSFRVNTKMMKIIGWYPQNRNPTFVRLQSYVLYVVFLLLFITLVIVDVLERKDYDIMQVIYVCGVLNYALKVLPFFITTQSRNIKKCINYFNDSDFNPEDDTEKKLTEDCVKLCRNITNIFITGAISATILYICPAVIRKGYDLPVYLWLPYDPKSGPLAYYSTVFYITVVLAGLYDICPTCLLDPLLGGLTYQAVTQLKILKHRVQHLHSFANETSPYTYRFSKNVVIYKNLKKCIKHHKAILRFVADYENCFSWPIFSQFFGTTMCLGFSCIALTKLPLVSVETAKFVMIFLVVASQVLFYCFFGTLLYEENNNLVTAIYNCKWYEYDVKTRKMLIMFMERSKQPMLLTAGKIIDLTLETFVMVLKRSYSLVAVLK